MIRNLLAKRNSINLSGHLIRGIIGTFGLMALNAVLVFGLAVLLARWLGKNDYGIYTYAMAWVKVLVIPTTLGFRQLLARNVAVYQAQSAWGQIRGLLCWTSQTSLFASVSLAILVSIIAFVIVRTDWPRLSTFWAAGILIPLLTLTRLRQATLRGLDHVVLAQLPERFVQPVLHIVFVAVAFYCLKSYLSALWAMGLNVVTTGITFAIGVALLNQKLPQLVKVALPVHQTRSWITSALPLLLTSTIFIVNEKIDTIMLGAIMGTDMVGVYDAVVRGAMFTSFVQLAVCMALSPTIANLYATGQMQRLQRIVTKGVRLSFLFTSFTGLAFILFGDWFLWLFGPEFVQGKTALIIMSIGRVIASGLGLTTTLPVMTKQERDSATSVGIGVLLNILLNALLVPRWGMVGAVTASATSLICRELLLAVSAYKRIGIHSTVLGKITLR